MLFGKQLLVSTAFFFFSLADSAWQSFEGDGSFVFASPPKACTLTEGSVENVEIRLLHQVRGFLRKAACSEDLPGNSAIFTV